MPPEHAFRREPTGCGSKPSVRLELVSPVELSVATAANTAKRFGSRSGASAIRSDGTGWTAMDDVGGSRSSETSHAMAAGSAYPQVSGPDGFSAPTSSTRQTSLRHLQAARLGAVIAAIERNATVDAAVPNGAARARRGTGCASRDPPASYPLADSKKGFVPLAWSVTSTTPVSSGTASRMATSMPWLRVTVAMPQPWHPPPRRR